MRTLAFGGKVAIVGLLLSSAHAAYAQPKAGGAGAPSTTTPGTTPAPNAAMPNAVGPNVGAPNAAAPNVGGPNAGSPNAAGANGAPPGAGAPGAQAQRDPLEVPKELLVVQAGGLTAEQVGARAASTSWSAKADEEALRGAAARVDEAWAAFLPRLSGIAKYTRLSPLTSPNLGTLVAATTPQQNPGGGNAFITPGNLTSENLVPVGLTFPVILDNYLLQGTLTIPFSDYLTKINQSYSAATKSQDAARWDIAGARATSASNGKVAYYTWLRARGAVGVAALTLEDQRSHYRDAQNQFTVGNASKADVLRAETAVASAELALDRAKNLAELTEKQVRVAIHAREEEAVAPGEDLEGSLSPVQGDIKQWTSEAVTHRPEMRSANANAEAAREQASAAGAGRWPSISGFADAIYASPNPRLIPQTTTAVGSWDIGAQLTWSPNDLLTTGGAVADAESKVAQIEANRGTVRDGIEIEVVQSWQAVQEADFSIGTSTRELTSALEAYRVQRELFTNGRGTSATLTDAEADLTRARLDLLNAKADARIARIRLDHALGRDASRDENTR